ncbi:MAG: hypothetical protein HQ477_07795 [Chloroflexi bacterium]|nr:hypothetical protein [Chloroflexota bacterium]
MNLKVKPVCAVTGCETPDLHCEDSTDWALVRAWQHIILNHQNHGELAGIIQNDLVSSEVSSTPYMTAYCTPEGKTVLYLENVSR